MNSSLKSEIVKCVITSAIVIAGLVGLTKLSSPESALAWGFATIAALGVWGSYASDFRPLIAPDRRTETERESS